MLLNTYNLPLKGKMTNLRVYDGLTIERFFTLVIPYRRMENLIQYE